MVWPEFVPLFTTDDILISDTEYESKNGKKTTIGWLKELFLYQKIGKDLMIITDEDRKIFKNVLDKFCKLHTIKVDRLHDWEEKEKPNKQSKALNQLMRQLGYTKIEEV
jgi:hypothetical protein